MVSELKIGTAYKTLRGFYTSGGTVLPNEIFTVVNIEYLPGRHGSFSEHNLEQFRVLVLHNNKVKTTTSFNREPPFNDLEEIT